MRLVPSPEIAPNRCAALPGVGAEHAGQWVDTGSEMYDGDFSQRIYLSDLAVLEAARLLGLEDPSELRARVVTLEAQIVSMEAELRDADRRLEAVDVMESAGFTARRKAGRPPKQREEMAA